MVKENKKVTMDDMVFADLIDRGRVIIEGGTEEDLKMYKTIEEELWSIYEYIKEQEGIDVSKEEEYVEGLSYMLVEYIPRMIEVSTELIDVTLAMAREIEMMGYVLRKDKSKESQYTAERQEELAMRAKHILVMYGFLDIDEENERKKVIEKIIKSIDRKEE